MDKKIVVQSIAEAENPPERVQIGHWFWFKGEEGERLGCVIHVGSNYVKLQFPKRRGTEAIRIHIDEFWDICRFEPNPDALIHDKVEDYKKNVIGLLEEVKRVTAQLAITPSPELQEHSMDAGGLVLHRDQNSKSVKTALEKAKKETLPDLFEQIAEQNELMAMWMSAQTIPYQAQAGGLEKLVDAIDDRIFAVELYAGLVEEVEKIRDGEPAELQEKIRLIQRRHYMDEECLAHYQTGGMEFKDLRAFDRWVIKKANRDRLLPFPRCIVAFQVRRHKKERHAGGWGDFFRILNEEKLDKLTFLYMRNGDRVYRLNTQIVFGETLFPDMERGLRGKLWAKMSSDGVADIISDNEKKGIDEERAQKAREQEELLRKTPEEDHWKVRDYDRDFDPRFEPFDRSSVYYDDIGQEIGATNRKHNRIGLVMQGLLDRSRVFEPHPDWKLFTDEGFNAGIELVYDSSRALAPAELPDFEEYRVKLNASLKKGSITIGQEEVWEEAMAAEENLKRRDGYHRDRYRPYDDPGPGKFAHVARIARGGEFVFTWTRSGRGDSIVQREVRASSDRLLNVDAYTPGDFRIFFDDPRTREKYLEWAPILLECEEFHAGNRKVAEFKPPKPKKPSSYEGQLRYRQHKRSRALVGKAGRNRFEVKMKSGKVYRAGLLWRVTNASPVRGLYVVGITPDGKRERDQNGCIERLISNLEEREFEIDYSIPPELKKKATENAS